MVFEESVVSLLVEAGASKSLAFEALAAAKEGDFKKAHALLDDAKKAGLQAHEAQTAFLQEEARGEKTELSLLMVHAQDHLMDSILARELITEMIELYERYEGRTNA